MFGLTMQRGIYLKDIVPQEISAQLKDGVLKIVVLKRKDQIIHLI